jgi:TatD DNase family protein
MPPSAPALVDAHAHLQDPAFRGDLEATVERARAAGVGAMICAGYDLASSRRAVELSERFPEVYAAVGLHPNDVAQTTDRDWAEVRELAGADRVVGIGETGLDNYRKRTTPEQQERWLWRHLELADELGLPIVIHNRDADERMCAILTEWSNRRRGSRTPGMMHCFSADRTMLDACLELGFAISIAGPVTFKTADPLREVAMAVPSDRLLVETDCPYLTPVPRRGQRNEPSYVAHTARFLADVRVEPFEALAAATTANAARLFGLEIPAPAAAASS